MKKMLYWILVTILTLACIALLYILGCRINMMFSGTNGTNFNFIMMHITIFAITTWITIVLIERFIIKPLKKKAR